MVLAITSTSSFRACSNPRCVSLLAYLGVPTSSLSLIYGMCFPCLPMNGLESPKSIKWIFSRPVAKFSTDPFFERQKFAGLISLWRSPCLCTSLIILTIYFPRLHTAVKLKISSGFFECSAIC